MTGPSCQHQSVVARLVVQLLAYFDTHERHGVEQYGLVHPIDRLVTIHRRAQGAGFGPRDMFEARGVLAVEGFPKLEIDWDQAFTDIPPVD